MKSQATYSHPTPRRPLSVWELPKLSVLVHTYRKSTQKSAKLRPHFPAILAFIHRNRLAIAEQVRRRFPQYLPSDRTARRHLAELEAAGLLGVQPVTNISPLMPKPYFVTRAGLRVLKQSFAERGKPWEPFAHDRRRNEGQSFQHVWHELATTEFLLSVWETVQSRPDLELLKTERRSLVKHPAFQVVVAGRQKYLQPDGLFVFRQHQGGMMTCLLEIDTGTESLRQLTAKLQSYRAWADSPTGQEYLCGLYSRFGAQRPTPAFRLLFVTSGNGTGDDSARLQALCRLMLDQPNPFRQRVWLTSGDSLRLHKRDYSLLEKPIWIRGRDIEQHGPLPSSAEDGARLLTAIPRYSLFPPQKP